MSSAQIFLKDLTRELSNEKIFLDETQTMKIYFLYSVA